jgi:hypothetical protein
MLKQIKNWLQPQKNDVTTDKETVAVSQKVVDKISSDPAFPYLVSSPRTGSHWLRMLMELYFERPTLVRAFYQFNNDDYLLIHTHDMELTTQRQNVIYLYREPISTVYSHIQYYNQDFNDPKIIAHWTGLYAQHLDKWLVTEKFTTHKTVLTYEAMMKDLPQAFAKVVAHFGATFNADKFAEVAKIVTKEEVKRKTPHDEQVVKLDSPYSQSREMFRQKHEATVWEILLKDHPHLKQFFAE